MGKVANPEIAKGVHLLGRAKAYGKKVGVLKKNKGKFPQTAPKAAPAAKAGKAPRFYPSEDVHKKLQRRHTPSAAKLRGSITPGTVLILLAGKFRGSRVVFLKQLPSGLLLVTGPFSFNGVPLRRVNQAYVIATSTQVNVSSVNVDKFDDAYFKKAQTRTKKTGDEFFKSEEEKKTEISAERKADQKAVDQAIVAAAKKEKFLQAYLSEKFSLRNGVYPHDMKF